MTFKLVPPTLPDRLREMLAPSVVDIQLVGDELARDVTFTWDRSVRRDPSSPRSTYVALHEVVSAETMSRIRSLVHSVATSLVADVRFMCFFTGPAARDDMPELERCISIVARHEAMSGAARIVEMDAEELDLATSRLGRFDAVRGVGVTEVGMSGLRANLRLFEPVPTTDRNFLFQPTGYDAIGVALEHGAFFFEEIGNGTRLRVASTAMSQAELTGKIESLLQGVEVVDR